MLYEDIVPGSEVAFAVEFGWDFSRKPYPFARAIDRTTFAAHQAGCRYRVRGEVIYADGWSWVLDCGIHVFFEDNPQQGYTPTQPYGVGEYLTGDVLLGIDPRSYHWLKPQPMGMPPVLYDWAIEGASKQVAPYIETKKEHGTSRYERDPLSWAITQLSVLEQVMARGGTMITYSTVHCLAPIVALTRTSLAVLPPPTDGSGKNAIYCCSCWSAGAA